MSKDKGTKNIKKAPADKSSGKGKAISAYKSETKSSQDKLAPLEAFVPKADQKAPGKRKS